MIRNFLYNNKYDYRKIKTGGRNLLFPEEIKSVYNAKLIFHIDLSLK
jgi:hypothetical protein